MITRYEDAVAIKCKTTFYGFKSRIVPITGEGFIILLDITGKGRAFAELLELVKLK